MTTVPAPSEQYPAVLSAFVTDVACIDGHGLTFGSPAVTVHLHLTGDAWEQLDRIIRHRWYDAQARQLGEAREGMIVP